MRPKRSRPTDETTTSISAPSFFWHTVAISAAPAACHAARSPASNGTGVKRPARSGDVRLTYARAPRESTRRPLSSVETSPVTAAPRSVAQATA